MSRILLPVDFSDRCIGMLPYAKAIAANYGAELILLHVAYPLFEVPPTGISGPMFFPVSKKTIEEQREALEKFGVDQLQGINVRRVMYEGNPEEQIVGFAKSEKIDLIAMPTHGYGVFRQFLVGSVTAKVLHDAACPVLTGVHLEDQPAGETAKFSNILCAIDLGPQSRGVLRWASELAAGFQARLGVVHAVPDTGFGPEGSMELTNGARKDVAALLGDVGATAAINIQVGEAAGAVCSAAKETAANLLVIGRGPHDSTGGTLAAQAYAIVRQSPCPVISVVILNEE